MDVVVSPSFPDPKMGMIYPGKSSGTTYGGALIYPSIISLLHAMAATTWLRFIMCSVVIERGGGGLGLQNNLLNKDWAEMCGAE